MARNTPHPNNGCVMSQIMVLVCRSFPLRPETFLRQKNTTKISSRKRKAPKTRSVCAYALCIPICPKAFTGLCCVQFPGAGFFIFIQAIDLKLSTEYAKV